MEIFFVAEAEPGPEASAGYLLVPGAGGLVEGRNLLKAALRSQSCGKLKKFKSLRGRTSLGRPRKVSKLAANTYYYVVKWRKASRQRICLIRHVPSAIHSGSRAKSALDGLQQVSLVKASPGCQKFPFRRGSSALDIYCALI